MHAAAAERREQGLILLKVAVGAAAGEGVHAVFFLRIAADFQELLRSFDGRNAHFIQNILTDAPDEVLTMMHAGQEVMLAVNGIGRVHIAVDELVGVGMPFGIHDIVQAGDEAFLSPCHPGSRGVDHHDIIFFAYGHQRVGLLIPLIPGRAHDVQLGVGRLFQFVDDTGRVIRIVSGLQDFEGLGCFRQRRGAAEKQCKSQKQGYHFLHTSLPPSSVVVLVTLRIS